ncbi:unnamed protein product [Paramecium primaurelia]|uniref:Protein kinase domain-containing protein n=1 Tax=Paramecium primaurelia TaxID=5886 RepID=A0A8S1LMS1_PARPR|nr:unnamed protein product [Paramecium primaurelia]
MIHQQNFQQQQNIVIEDDDEDLIPMTYDNIPQKKVEMKQQIPQHLAQSINPTFNLTPIRQKIHSQILEHANQIIDGEVDISDFIIQYNELVFYEQIASGGSGVVYRGRFKNEIVAIKDIDINEKDEQKMKEYKREIVTLVKVRHHQNLVCLVGITFHQNKLYIITEFCSGGSLFDLIHRNRETKIDQLTKLKLSLFIAEGMAYIHKLGFMHRDLKSLNILLDQPFSPDSNIKIADFGLARTALEKTEWMTAVVGTFHWMAPEVFRGEMYTNKADVYSYGIVLYEIFSRQIPYMNIANPMQIMKAVTEQNQRPDLSFECQQEIKALMAQCWHPNPEQRPTFEQIINSLQSL